MKDPNTIRELNEQIRLLESALMQNSTRIRILTAMRARAIKKKRQKLADLMMIKIEEYKRMRKPRNGKEMRII